MKKALAAAAAAVALASAGAVLLFPEAPPSFERVRGSFERSEAVLLGRHGEVVHELRVEARGRRLEWTPLDRISPALVSAVVFAEDKRFYAHAGVDWRAAAAAAVEGLRSGRPRGASTVTMQLASLLDADLRPRGASRSLRQKLGQVMLARALERRWTKPQILEAYLNLLTFRGELQGVAAASEGLFGKEPHGLTPAESLVLASLPRAPAASAERIARRAARLGAAMGADVARAALREALARGLAEPHRIRPAADLAPHVALRLLERARAAGAGSARVLRSTLDAGVQRFALEALRGQLAALRGQNARDAAALVVDNRTGDVLAYVGNVGDASSARYVDGVAAARQTGSTLKPFLYALALDERVLTAASLLDDSPLDLPEGASLFSPENYDHRFRGLVPVRTALASSINVPAVRALQLVGAEAFLQKLGELGVGRLRSAEFYGPSLALGTADASLWELVDAYRTLANGGRWSPLRLAPEEKATQAARRVYSPEASFVVSDILSDREGRSETFGLESPLATRYWTAVKTGTSKDMRDNWCVGYSDRYTVGVWVGNFDGSPMWDVSGMSGAAPAWVEIMDRLHQDRPSAAPPSNAFPNGGRDARPPAWAALPRPPRGLVARAAEFPASLRPRTEWFLRGTEPSAAARSLQPARARIVYPPPGEVIALDPDIPDSRQSVLFEAAPRDGGLRWELNGAPLGGAGGPVPWNPRAGDYELALVDASHRVLDSVRFVVRGDPSDPISPEDPGPDADADEASAQ